jgi:hypothetical protein
MAFVIAIMLIVFVLGPIARALAVRLGRGGDAALPGAPQEVARLREEVDRLGVEVARLTDEQAFMLRLLAPGEQKQAAGGDDPAGPPPVA